MAPHKSGRTIDVLPDIPICALYDIYMLCGTVKEFWPDFSMIYDGLHIVFAPASYSRCSLSLGWYTPTASNIAEPSNILLHANHLVRDSSLSARLCQQQPLWRESDWVTRRKITTIEWAKMRESYFLGEKAWGWQLSSYPYVSHASIYCWSSGLWRSGNLVSMNRKMLAVAVSKKIYKRLTDERDRVRIEVFSERRILNDSSLSKSQQLCI